MSHPLKHWPGLVVANLALLSACLFVGVWFRHPAPRDTGSDA